MQINTAIRLAVRNLASDGLDDVLPTPFEIEMVRKNEALRKTLEQRAKTKLSSGKLEKLDLLPISYVLVPKKEAFDYRKIEIIRPEDLVLYQSLAFFIAKAFEVARRSVAQRRVFSYRFKPNSRTGQVFDPKYNLKSFQSASARKEKSKSGGYVVKSDISNFYDRINIHRIDSTLLTTSGVDEKYASLINQMLLHWARRDSYGLPVGSNASRILAEVALFNVDTALKEAGVDFIRFVDDFRIYTKSASEAHSALGMLIDLLSREGLFINIQKTSINRIAKAVKNANAVENGGQAVEKLEIKEFKIRAGYGGTIPIKFRMPAKKSQEKYLHVDLDEIILTIEKEDFATSDQMKDLLFGIILQEKFSKLKNISRYLDRFPQFYPLFVDMLIRNVEHFPEGTREDIRLEFSKKLMASQFLSEFAFASIVSLVGDSAYFDRRAIMGAIRGMKRSEGVYVGRVLFDAAQNLRRRIDALEIREFFDRSNEWERRRIIRLMQKVLPKEEYRAWRRAIRTYIAEDPFAIAMK